MGSISGRCSNIFVSPPVSSPEPGSVVAHSHFQEPIREPLAEGGEAHGRSRRWGDASEEVQRTVVGEILRQGAALGWQESDLSFALSVARLESGFNPDAAATSTSASGVGQFIDSTGAAFGLSERSRFSIHEGVRAFLAYLGETLAQAKRQLLGASEGEIYRRSYALYHDGPSLKFGGAEIAQAEILPRLAAMREVLSCF